MDGVTHSWSVLDPLEKAAVTIRLKQPVTVESVAVWLTISTGLAVAKEVAFEGDGKAADRDAGSQERPAGVPLPAPATFQELKLTVLDLSRPRRVGSIGEIEGFDRPDERAAGAAALRAPGHRSRAGEIPGNQSGRSLRPVFMTLTGNFHPHFGNGPTSSGTAVPRILPGDRRRRLRHLSDLRLEQARVDLPGPRRHRFLAKLAGQRPLYAWIETSKGGQCT